MRALQRLRLRLRSLLHRSRVERELADELSFHLEEQIAENRAAGMSADEARLAASRLLGGVSQIQEEWRDMRMTTIVEGFFRDFRYALRVIRKNPAFASASILVLALGIGANTAIFSVANAILFRPLPFPEPQQLVRLWDTYGTPGNLGPISYPNFQDWRSSQSVDWCSRAWARRRRFKRLLPRRVSSKCWAYSRRWAGSFCRKKTVRALITAPIPQ
jgi:hypothetical protein